MFIDGGTDPNELSYKQREQKKKKKKKEKKERKKEMLASKMSQHSVNF